MDQPLRAFTPDERAQGPPQTVSQVVECYLSHSAPSRSADSAKEKKRVLDSFCEEFGSRRVKDLRPYDLMFWIDGHESWTSNHTKNRVKNTVRRPFSWAANVGLIDKNPFSGVSYPAGETGRDATDAEFRSLLRNSTAPFRRILFFLRWTGSRPIELRRLEWEQIRTDLGAALQKVHKTAHSTRKPRRIPLIREVIKLLDWIKRHQPAGSRYVFLNARGKQWTKRAICQRMQRVREKAGLPRDLKLYSHRHAFGTGAILNGVDLATLARLMGHASVKTTEIYVHLADKDAHLIKAAEQAIKRRK